MITAIRLLFVEVNVHHLTFVCVFLVEDVVWNYGQYGLLGILMREEIMQGIKTL